VSGLSKPLAKAVTAIKFVVVGTSVVGLTILGAPGAFAGPTGPVIVPEQLATPTAETAYSVVPAHCVNGQSVEGVVTVNPLAHAQSRLGGELATTYSGYGQVSLAYIADAGYTFANGQLVGITPSPDLGSVQNCAPAQPPQATITPSATVEGEGTFTYVVPSTDSVSFMPLVNGQVYGRAVTITGDGSSHQWTFPYSGLKGGDVVTITGNGVELARLVLPSFAPVLKEVTPLAPTITDHTITIPSVEGVIYTKADGTVLPAGTWGVGSAKVGLFTPNPDGSFPVLAKAADGYVLVGLAHYNWPFVFGTPVPADTVNTLWVTICHSPNSDKNPYKEITVNANAILHEHANANGEQESGHASHERDVIPGFPYIEGGVAKVFPGLNDDAAGENLLMHGCEVEDQGGVENPTPENPAPGNNDTPPVDTTKPETPATGGGDTAPVTVANPETPQVPAATDTTTTNLPPAALANVGSSIQTSDVTESNRTGTIADAETAADGGSANWFAIAAGLGLMVAAFYKKGLRRQS
jgi:hypothetical protein